MRAILLTAVILLAAVPQLAAEDGCYADCADGLWPAEDLGPAAGEAAPTFRALLFDPATGTAAERPLEALLDGRPVILAFGSYT